jgi:hypothetical protein
MWAFASMSMGAAAHQTSQGRPTPDLSTARSARAAHGFHSRSQAPVPPRHREIPYISPLSMENTISRPPIVQERPILEVLIVVTPAFYSPQTEGNTDCLLFLISRGGFLCGMCHLGAAQEA